MTAHDAGLGPQATTAAAPGEPLVEQPTDTVASRQVTAAHRDLRAVLALRAGLAVLGAVVLIVAMVQLAEAGITTHLFPPFIAGDSSTPITAYSGPLLAGAIGCGAVAGLLLVSAVTDMWRRALMGRSLAQCRAGLGH